MTLSRSTLQIPYLAVRMPFSLLDELVVVRVFGSESSAHRVLSQGLQQLDALAESVFGPGAGSADDTPPSADNAAREPTQDTPAQDTPTAHPTERVESLPVDEQQEITELADAFEAEQELAPRAGELAEDSEIRRVQAQIRAKQTIEGERGQL